MIIASHCTIPYLKPRGDIHFHSPPYSHCPGEYLAHSRHLDVLNKGMNVFKVKSVYRKIYTLLQNSNLSLIEGLLGQVLH